MVNSLLFVALVAVLIWSSIIDFRHMILPDAATLAVAALGGLRLVLTGEGNVLDAGLGVVLGGGLLLCTRAAFRHWRQRDSLGLGDVKLLAAGGIWVGAAGIGPVVLIATFAALLAFMLRAFRLGRAALRDPMPFGPFLAFGLVAVVVFIDGPVWIGF